MSVSSISTILKALHRGFPVSRVSPIWKGSNYDKDRDAAAKQANEEKKAIERATLCDLLDIKLDVAPVTHRPVRIFALDGPSMGATREFLARFPSAEVWVCNPEASALVGHAAYKRLPAKDKRRVHIFGCMVEEFFSELYRWLDHDLVFDLIWLDLVKCVDADLKITLFNIMASDMLVHPRNREKLGTDLGILAVDVCERKTVGPMAGATRLEVAACVATTARSLNKSTVPIQGLAQPVISGAGGFPLQIFILQDRFNQEGRGTEEIFASRVNACIRERHVTDDKRISLGYSMMYTESDIGETVDITVVIKSGRKRGKARHVVVRDVDPLVTTVGDIRKHIDRGRGTGDDYALHIWQYAMLDLHDDCTLAHYGLTNGDRIIAQPKAAPPKKRARPRPEEEEEEEGAYFHLTGGKEIPGYEYRLHANAECAGIKCSMTKRKKNGQKKLKIERGRSSSNAIYCGLCCKHRHKGAK